MIRLRHQFREDGAEYAGFERADGRYCFYFVDQNIIKTQNLDNGEVEYFNVHAFSEFDLEKVAEELQMLAQQLNQGS